MIEARDFLEIGLLSNLLQAWKKLFGFQNLLRKAISFVCTSKTSRETAVSELCLQAADKVSTIIYK